MQKPKQWEQKIASLAKLQYPRGGLSNLQGCASTAVVLAGSKHTICCIVDWTLVKFASFKAYLCTSRHAGTRKADMLDVVPDDFDASSLMRSNFRCRQERCTRVPASSLRHGRSRNIPAPNARPPTLPGS